MSEYMRDEPVWTRFSMPVERRQLHRPKWTQDWVPLQPISDPMAGFLLAQYLTEQARLDVWLKLYGIHSDCRSPKSRVIEER